MLFEIPPHKLDNQYKNVPLTGDAKVIVFKERDVLSKCDAADSISLPIYDELGIAMDESQFVYAFSIDDTPYFLARFHDMDLPEGFKWFSVMTRNPWKTMDEKVNSFATMTAWHLNTWYENVNYCGHCGAKNNHHDKFRAMVCPKCGAMHFPKISPAAIIAVTKGDSILMSKYANREYTGFALLAGFIEIGETAEEAVAREVFEEVGLKIKNVRYYKTEPWGRDGNLSMGYFCELDGEDTITLDQEELAMAQWYKREDIPVEDDGFSLTYNMIGYFKDHPEEF